MRPHAASYFARRARARARCSPRSAASHGPNRAPAATIDAIVRDEERHVRYARAIARRYAPDDAALAAALAWARAVEARAFEAHGRAFTQHVLASGLAGAPARVAMQVVTGVSRATSRARADVPAGSA